MISYKLQPKLRECFFSHREREKEREREREREREEKITVQQPEKIV